MRLRLNKILMFWVIIWVCVGAVTYFEVVFAQANNLDLGLQFAQNTGLPTQDIRITIATIIRGFMGILGLVAVGLMMYAGVVWMTAGGEQGKVDSAKSIMRNAVIGLVIIVLSFGIAQFVLSTLKDALLTGTGGAAQGVGSGGGIVGAGSGVGGSFSVIQITPRGKILIRNPEVSLLFNKNVESVSVNKNTIRIEDSVSGTLVEGSFTVSGSEVIFKPQASCPAPNSSEKCFSANTSYKVVVSTSPGVKSIDKKDVTCLFGSVCQVSFETGSLIDTTDPIVHVSLPLDGASVSQNSKVELQAQAKDDWGIGSVNFFVNNSTLGLDPQIDKPAQHSPLFNAQSRWDTTGLPLKSTYAIKASTKDIAGKSAISSEVNVMIRAAHCFNKKQDLDESGIDCGGADCGSCQGASCSTNSQCQSGYCSAGFCRMLTIIKGFNPGRTAQETFVSIYGSGFGKFTTGLSQVNFLDVNLKKVAGIFPQQCGITWTDEQIIVEIPKTLADGVYHIEVITGDICDPKTQTPCSDNTANEIGIKSWIYIDAKEARPSLCLAQPDAGKYQDKFLLEGRGFGAVPVEINIGGFKTSAIGAWSNEKIKDVLVPNVLPDRLPVYLNVAGKQSNAVYFDVQRSADMPTISNIFPDNGGEGQYIQIIGTGFGAIASKVWFVDPISAIKVLADNQTFPVECAGGLWHDRQVIVKVPKDLVNQKVYEIVVEMALGQSNKVLFTRNNNPKTPGICKIDPIQGPVQSLLVLYGENFGSTVGKVNFGSNKVVQTQAGWSNQKIEARLPNVNPGTIKIQVISSDGFESNFVDFIANSCKAQNNTCSIVGYSCCQDGTCRNSCPIAPQNGSFTWKFSTGIIPEVLPEPEVLMEQWCGVGKFQSPSPWVSSIDACPNADVSVLFTLPMDGAGFVGTGSNRTVTIQECKDEKTCIATPLEISSMRDIIGKGGSIDGFILVLPNVNLVNAQNASFKPATWYKVTLKGGVSGIKAKNGMPLRQDYTWSFKTRTELCDLALVKVYPEDAIIDKKDGKQDLEASGQAQNCNRLNAANFIWTWRTSRPGYVDFVQAGLTVAKQVAQGIQETGSQPSAMSAETQTIIGKSLITVDFKDPNVVRVWPDCQGACVNASIGAEFAAPLNPSSLVGQFEVVRCDTSTCTQRKTFLPLTPLTYKVEKELLFIEHKGLSENEYYRVIIRSGIKSISNTSMTVFNYDYDQDGKNDSYSWIFRTKNDKTPCVVNKVNVRPIKGFVSAIGDQHDFAGEPLSAPDDCNPLGQLLDPFSYDWNWSSGDMTRAEVYARTQFDSKAIQRGCSSNCLTTGSFWRVAVCANMIIEFGEDCDDGNIIEGDGCSSTCLNEGTKAPSCGNGTQEVGEDCDDGKINNGDGCSAICLNEGSDGKVANCGNGVNKRGMADVGEDCDDGNAIDGDGCSAICLNEGSLSKNTISVCGDGVIDPGEDCDEGGICQGGLNNGASCGRGVGCPGDLNVPPVILPGICKPSVTPIRGCSSICRKIGNADATFCGNGVEDGEKGEQCDDKNNINGDGCSSICLLEGSASSNGALCGNGLPEIGESRLCELALPPSAKGGPYTWAKALSFIQDKPELKTSTAPIIAAIKTQSTIQGQGSLVLQCGYGDDRACGDPTKRGRGLDTCCYARPEVKSTTELPLYPQEGSGISYCTNTLIQVPFNMPMDEISLNGNIIIAEGTTQATCSSGAQKLDYSSDKSLTWCVGGVTITPTLDLTGRLLYVGLNNFLQDNTSYLVIVKGDSNLEDDAVVGVTSKSRVGYAGVNQRKIKIDGVEYNAFAFTFKTATKCLLSQVDIKNTAQDLKPFAFAKSGEEKNYKSFAMDANANLIQSVPGIYAWTWRWELSPKDIFSGKNTVISANSAFAPQDLYSIKASGKNGRGLVVAQARIESSTLPGILSSCSVANDCQSGVCLNLNDKPCGASECGNVAKPVGHCSIYVAGAVDLDAFICENIWPTQGSLQKEVYEDKLYNFSIRYCRDAGVGKVCRGLKDNGRVCNSDENCSTGSKCVMEVSDDLPIAQLPTVRALSGKICIGGLNTNNACKDNNDCKGVNTGNVQVPDGACQSTDLLSEYLFLMRREQKTCHNTNRESNSTRCSIDDDCLKNKDLYTYCYADVGSKLMVTNDAIGFRIMKNNLHKSAARWYADTISKNTQAKGGSTVDGYNAAQEGRTVYVNAVNSENDLANSFYTNIYLMSYNENALPETQEVYKQLFSNLSFNINMSPLQKKKAQRDTYRLEDLHEIAILLDAYKRQHGSYPKLDAGSYVKGMSFSTWPSWQNALSSLLGTQLPVDPINTFKKCAPGFSEKTCWDANSLKFDASTILKTDNSLDEGSFVYQYRTADNGATYTLGYNAEFLGLTIPQGGTAYQCYDENSRVWVSNGQCHTVRSHTKCMLGSWRSSCGNGIPNDCSDQCDGVNVNFCASNMGVCVNGKKQCRSNSDCGQGDVCQMPVTPITWQNEVVQVCSSSCELFPSTESLKKINNGVGQSCGGFCGDGVVTNGEMCEPGKQISATCESLGWGRQGKVACSENSCGYIGAGCLNGPLSKGDIRVQLEWASVKPIKGQVDLDLILMVPEVKITVTPSGANGKFSDIPYAWATFDDKYAINGNDIDNDNSKDGMELITYRQVPAKNSYYKGTYKLLVHSYGSEDCFNKSCKDIRVIVTKSDSKTGSISKQTFTFPSADLDKSSNNSFWQVFTMDESGVISEVVKNKFVSSLPTY